MKQYLCLLIFLVILIGCVDQNTKNEKIVKRLQKVAELSPQIENQLPLGLKFGLTKVQTEKVIDSLITNMVLKKGDDSYNYDYKCKFDSIEISCWVNFEYYRDTLYCLRFNFFPRDNVINLEKLISSKISKELGSKYSKNNYVIFNHPLTFWIKDNKEVSLCNRTFDLNLAYINKPLDKRQTDETVSFEVNRMIEKINKPTIKNSSWDGSVHQVEGFIKNNLKDPDSYKSMDWGKVIENDKGYSVQHTYRAKNSFGGYVIKNETFQLDKDGKVIGKSE